MSNKTKIVGLTGGIGSGKTTVANAFLWLGVPVFYADDEAKMCYTEDSLVREGMVALFGSEIYLSSQELNKSKLSALVFSNPEARKEVEQLVHPAVKRRFDRWLAMQHAPYVVREAAILFESGSYVDCDFILTVESPSWLRVDRVVARSGGTLTKQGVEARMQAQWTDEQRASKATMRLVNDNSNLLLPQIIELHRKLMA